jgi:hypothetical protein
MKEKQYQETPILLLPPDEEYGNGFQNDKEDVSRFFGIRP